MFFPQLSKRHEERGRVKDVGKIYMEKRKLRLVTAEGLIVFRKEKIKWT